MHGSRLRRASPAARLYGAKIRHAGTRREDAHAAAEPDDAVPLPRDLQQPSAGTHAGACAAHHGGPAARGDHPPMKYAGARPYADLETRRARCRIVSARPKETAPASEGGYRGRAGVRAVGQATAISRSVGRKLFPLVYFFLNN